MEVADLTGGGAPALGEPLAIELGNATYAVRGRRRDGLQTVEHLAAWLRDMRPRLAVALTDDDLRGVTEGDLSLARELRDTIRALADAAVNGREPASDAVDTLNAHARQSPQWPELRISPKPQVVVASAGRPIATALCMLAQDAVGLFGGPLGYDVRACQGPGCVLYFVHGVPRREWCSAGCGNRARAARHYARVRRRT